jgi:hypothetical protein
MLDERFVPLGHPDAEPMPPAYPSRLRFFLYACGLVAEGEPTKTLTVQSPQQQGRGGARRGR